MKKYSIIFNDVNIEFTVIPRERKTVKINVHPDGNVQALVPLDSDIVRIKKIVKKKGNWILKQKRYFEQFNPIEPQREYVSGETFRYLNRQYRLKILPSEKNEVKLAGGYFIMKTRRKDDSEYNKKLLYGWYRSKASIKYHELVDHILGKLKKYGVKKPTVMIKKMKTRWGSCVPLNKKILLNLELIRAPTHCIEYVIMHELIHLKHPHHNKDFYDFLSLMMPDWKERKSRLEHITIIG